MQKIKRNWLETVSKYGFGSQSDCEQILLSVIDYTEMEPKLYLIYSDSFDCLPYAFHHPDCPFSVGIFGVCKDWFNDILFINSYTSVLNVLKGQISHSVFISASSRFQYRYNFYDIDCTLSSMPHPRIVPVNWFLDLLLLNKDSI